MSKKDFISLADIIRESNAAVLPSEPVFGVRAINQLAHFCKTQNPAFNESRWLAYIAGECGSNGGKVKK